MKTCFPELFICLYALGLFSESVALCPTRPIPLCLCQNGTGKYAVGKRIIRIVKCYDSRLTSQSQVDEIFRLLRIANKASPTDKLIIGYLKLRFDTNFKLDLSPFLNSQFINLEISESPGLTFVPSPTNPSPASLIIVGNLTLRNNGLTFERLGAALTFFNSNMSSLDLSSNQLAPSQNTVLPGLSLLNQLTLLNFYDNFMRKIPDNFFQFEPNPVPVNTTLKIHLNSNGLDSEDFSPSSGLERLARPVTLGLEVNLIRSLSAPIFEPILNASPYNRILLRGNIELTCDARMAWLQRKSGTFFGRVEGAECANDRGNNVFNSTKVGQPFAYRGVSKCPDPAVIAPCQCKILLDDANSLTCQGPLVTQAAVTQVLHIMRNASETKVDDTLVIDNFKLDAPARALNLSLFNRVRIRKFSLTNRNWAQLTGPTVSEEGRFDVQSVLLQKGHFTDRKLGKILFFFSPNMTQLYLNDNLLEGPGRFKDSDCGEFLPGLSTLTRLKVLNLQRNRIEELAGGPVKTNGMLRSLSLANNVKLRRIGTGAFLFDSTPAHLYNTSLTINLENCGLTESSFAVDWGLERFPRPVILLLGQNKMRSLPEEIFGPILRSHQQSQLSLLGNPLECDDRLAWLQNDRAIFERQVFAAVCSNDGDNSIFESTLVQKRAPTKCPTFGIFPCTCKSSLEVPGDVDCSGPEVKQDHINRVLTSIREVNSLRPDGQIRLSKLRIYSPFLSVLDLSPFSGVHIDHLSIEDNSNLEQIFCPPHPRIPVTVNHLSITNNSLLTDAGLTHCLQFISKNITTLELSGNSLTATGNEFLKGLASLPNLSTISLANNKIQTLRPTLFHNNTKLTSLNLINNQITDIAMDTFPFNNVSPPLESQNLTLTIFVGSNELTSHSRPFSFGLERVGRRVHLDLSNNLLTTLPRAQLTAFLQAYPGNSLDLLGNPLVCDAHVEWLTEKKAQFFSAVQNADCGNHPGQTIFNFHSPNILGTVLGTTLPLLFILLLAFLAFGYNYKQMKKKIRDLTPEEILRFKKGGPVGDENAPYSVIYGQPFDEKWEISADIIEVEIRKTILNNFCEATFLGNASFDLQGSLKLTWDRNDVLGSGQFGVVYSGYLLTCPGASAGKQKVAVKTVESSVDVENFKALLAEIKIMCHLDGHPNIISIFGASTQNIQKRQALAVLEFCVNGDLLKFLLERRKNFTNLLNSDLIKSFSETTEALSTIDLLRFAVGVANGMCYLTTKNVIHADLACRNILLTAGYRAKISDFGLARQLQNYPNYIKKSQTPVPFRWMSIEALKDQKFSIKSDVWSFGVVLWEIFSLGEMPYSDTNCIETVISILKNGNRLQKPELANNQMYELMLDCWKTEPVDRLAFSQIHSTLVNILTSLLSQMPRTPYVDNIILR